MKKTLMIVTAAAALAFAGCVSAPAEEGGGWTFAPVEAMKIAFTKVEAIPDDTKADILEGLAWLLGLSGAGAAAVPLAKAAAGYFRRRGKNGAAAASTATAGDAGATRDVSLPSAEELLAEGKDESGA